MTQPIDALGEPGDVFAVLARSVPARLIEISRSGCLLESRHRIEDGTVGELRLQVHGELLVDDVRVTRCVLVEGSGSSYRVGAEFVQTRRPGERSIRRAITSVLRGGITDAIAWSRSRVRNEEKAEAIASAGDVNVVSPGEAVMKNLLGRLVREEEGQDLIEYALLAGLITTGVVAFITTIGQKVLGYFTALDGELPAPPAP